MRSNDTFPRWLDNDSDRDFAYHRQPTRSRILHYKSGRGARLCIQSTTSSLVLPYVLRVRGNIRHLSHDSIARPTRRKWCLAWVARPEVAAAGLIPLRYPSCFLGSPRWAWLVRRQRPPPSPRDLPPHLPRPNPWHQRRVPVAHPGPVRRYKQISHSTLKPRAPNLASIRSSTGLPVLTCVLRNFWRNREYL
jgi:hypothetical protein